VKLDNKLVCHFLLAILCVSLTGCRSVSSYEPLGSGYIWVTHTQNSISEPSASQFELQYSPGKGKWWKKVWPDLYPSGIVIKDQVAVFVGNKASKRSRFYEPWPTESRLFAVKAPEMPMDITDQVFQQYCEKTGLAFTNIVKDGIGSLKKTDDAVEMDFIILSRGERGPGTINSYGTTMMIYWNQLSDIMREVKEKGVVRKDLRWGTKYLEIEFKPEVQK
jgi:hypothetical protein